MSYRTALAEVLHRAVAPRAELTGMEGRFPRGAVTAFGATGLLGLTVSTEFGGAGLGLPEAAEVVARTALVCPATAAVLRSHYTAVAVIESYGSPWVRGEIAAGRHLSSLALLEDVTGCGQETEAQLLMARGTAVRSGGVVALRGRKYGVVAAGEADSYVWSSRPLGTPDGLSLWGGSGVRPGPVRARPARRDGAAGQCDVHGVRRPGADARRGEARCGRRRARHRAGYGPAVAARTAGRRRCRRTGAAPHARRSPTRRFPHAVPKQGMNSGPWTARSRAPTNVGPS